MHTSLDAFIANGEKHKISHHYEKKPFFAVARNETMSRHSERGMDMKEWGTNVSNSSKIYLQLRQTNMAKPPVLRAHAAQKLSAETRKRWTQKLCRNR